MARQDEGTAGPAWGEAERTHFERRLLEERRRALVEMARFSETFSTSTEEATGELTSWRFHMADLGTETEEQEKNFLLASREGRLLWHVDEALRRLYRAPESFGRCAECGATIAYERLDAIPYVVNCKDCKAGWEAGQ